MEELITFLHVVGNLFLAAIIFVTLIFTTVYYMMGYMVKKIKLTPLIKRSVSFKRGLYFPGFAALNHPIRLKGLRLIRK